MRSVRGNRGALVAPNPRSTATGAHADETALPLAVTQTSVSVVAKPAMRKRIASLRSMNAMFAVRRATSGRSATPEAHRNLAKVPVKVEAKGMQKAERVAKAVETERHILVR